MHLIILLGDKAQVEARFSLFGDSANLDARYVHSLRRTYHRLRNRFERTFLGDVGHLESHFNPFGDNVSVSASRCMVCAKRTICL
jgi:hypothetical protein